MTRYQRFADPFTETWAPPLVMHMREKYDKQYGPIPGRLSATSVAMAEHGSGHDPSLPRVLTRDERDYLKRVMRLADERKAAWEAERQAERDGALSAARVPRRFSVRDATLAVVFDRGEADEGGAYVLHVNGDPLMDWVTLRPDLIEDGRVLVNLTLEILG